MSQTRERPSHGQDKNESGQIYSNQADQEVQLRDQLADFLFCSGEEDFDSAALDTLLERLDEIDPMPEEEDGAQRSLERFHEKYDPVFSALETASAAKPDPPRRKKRSGHVLKAVSITAAVILLLGSAIVSASGLDIAGTIARWTSEIFRLGSYHVPYAKVRENPLADGETAVFDSLQQAVDAFGITEPLAPRWIPERFALSEIVAANQRGQLLIWADYTSGDEFFQIRYRQAETSDLTDLEKEDGNAELYSCGGIDHYLTLDMERRKAVWKNGELECRMSGTVSEQEIKEIIYSIYFDSKG